MKRYRAEAIALLLVGGAAQFAYKWTSPDAAADVWNVGQALLCAFLLAMVAAAYGGAVRGVAALLGVWQLMTAGCSLSWLTGYRWNVEPGGAQCSAALDLPLGIIGLWLLLVLALRLHQKELP